MIIYEKKPVTFSQLKQTRGQSPGGQPLRGHSLPTETSTINRAWSPCTAAAQGETPPSSLALKAISFSPGTSGESMLIWSLDQENPPALYCKF